MNTWILVYTIGVVLSLGYFVAEHHVLVKRSKTPDPLTIRKWLILVFISLTFPITWVIIVLHALGFYHDNDVL